MSSSTDNANHNTAEHIRQMQAALRAAVADALERKRRLGQYAVHWENGQVVLRGEDAPRRSHEALKVAEPTRRA